MIIQDWSKLNSPHLMHTDRKEFASTVLWLEDQKIRFYTIDDREKLRNLDNMLVWEEGYKQYCIDLNMPPYETQLEQLTWMVGHAIRLEFLDDPAQYESINSQATGQIKNNGSLSQHKTQTLFNGKINGEFRTLIYSKLLITNIY